MNAPSVDIKSILVSALGLIYAIDLFVAEMPESPDRCVTIIDSGGNDAESQYIYERPTIQILVRGERGEYEYDLAKAIKDELHGTANETVGGTRYVGIWAEGDILSLGQDENKRSLLSINFRIHRTV